MTDQPPEDMPPQPGDVCVFIDTTLDERFRQSFKERGVDGLRADLGELASSPAANNTKFINACSIVFIILTEEGLVTPKTVPEPDTTENEMPGATPQNGDTKHTVRRHPGRDWKIRFEANHGNFPPGLGGGPRPL